MRLLLTLLLTFALAVSAYASAGQMRNCCPDADCPVVQCMEMGCLPAVGPVIPQAVPAMPRWDAARKIMVEPQVLLPTRYKEIWTPPD